jgi:hypothetical protein
MSRLDSVAPDLAEKFRKATPTQRRAATLAACALAVSQVALEGSAPARALEHMRLGGAVDSELRRQLEALATELDDAYLRLEGEGGRTLTSLRMFQKARAVSSLVFGLTDDPCQLHEAIYEAIAAFDDAAGVTGRVSALLEV